jgi:SAM-dependent methyltransferase
MRSDELRARYPEYADRWIVEPDLLDDAGSLRTVAEASQDFVIANHVLEHMEDPVGALAAWLRVLVTSGVLYLAVPDKRSSFDGLRPSTSIEHVLRDHREGPAWSRSGHYQEYVRLAERAEEHKVGARAAMLEGESVDIHFHVWSQPELITLLLYLADHEGLPFDLELVQRSDDESLLILRRT